MVAVRSFPQSKRYFVGLDIVKMLNLTSYSEVKLNLEIVKVFSKITMLRDNKNDPMALVLRHVVNSVNVNMILAFVQLRYL